MMQLRDSTALRPITSFKMRDAGNVLRTITTGKIRDAAGTLRTFYSTLSAVAAPNNVYGVATSFYGQTNATNVTVTGGTPPYTYSWAQVGAEPGWSIAGTNIPNPSFIAPVPPTGTTINTNFQCTVTDAIGNVVLSNLVTASVSNPYGNYLPYEGTF